MFTNVRASHHLPETPQVPSLLGGIRRGGSGYYLLCIEKCLVGRGFSAEASMFDLKSLLWTSDCSFLLHSLPFLITHPPFI